MILIRHYLHDNRLTNDMRFERNVSVMAKEKEVSQDGKEILALFASRRSWILITAGTHVRNYINLQEFIPYFSVEKNSSRSYHRSQQKYIHIREIKAVRNAFYLSAYYIYSYVLRINMLYTHKKASTYLQHTYVRMSLSYGVVILITSYRSLFKRQQFHYYGIENWGGEMNVGEIQRYLIFNEKKNYE